MFAAGDRSYFEICIWQISHSSNPVALLGNMKCSPNYNTAEAGPFADTPKTGSPKSVEHGESRPGKLVKYYDGMPKRV